RRYAKFGALTNQALSRPAAVQRTTPVHQRGILHRKCAICGGKFTSAGPWFLGSLDLGAATCLLMDSEYSESICRPTGSQPMNLPSGALQGRRIPSTEANAAGAAGLRAFGRIADLWHLSIAEQLTLLGLSSRSTY